MSRSCYGAPRNSLFLFLLSCIVQKCPLSESFFATVSHPVYRCMENKLAGSPSRLRMCAGNIGGALRSLGELILLAGPFKLAQQAIGLSLKLPKCNVVPLGPFTEATNDSISCWLRSNIPSLTGLVLLFFLLTPI